jgi:hypothetical protein
VDTGALLTAGIGCAIAVVTWRWSVPYNASFYKMVKARDPSPGSWFYKSLQVGKWAGTGFGVLIAVIGLASFLTSL